MKALLDPPPALAPEGGNAAVSRGVSPSELVLVSSGPGEVSHWAVPMARTAASWAAQRGVPLNLSLILPPCQFASGQEIAYARRQALFARILGPPQCLGLVTGLSRFPGSGPGCVLHLGGDLWYSATLGRRLGFPAFAYVETPLVRKRAHRFQRVFVPSRALADRLIVAGVPATRLSVVGDLRVEHLSAFRAPALRTLEGSRVALLPGSRRWIIEGLLPFLLDVAAAMHARRPAVRFALIVSPFLPPEVLARTLDRYRGRLTILGVDIVEEDRMTALGQSDLAITLPGTNTVELAILGVPMLVILPLSRPARIRTEGLSEWIGRIPGLGNAVKTVMAWRLARRPGLLAWPNREAGRAVVPEVVGRITPADVARHALELLSDRELLARTARELRELYPTPAGVAEHIMNEMVPFLRQPSERSAALA